jgi:hypothetical protein
MRKLIFVEKKTKFDVDLKFIKIVAKSSHKESYKAKTLKNSNTRGKTQFSHHFLVNNLS